MAERGLAAPRTEHAPPCLWSNRNLDYRHHRYQEQLPNSDFEQAPSLQIVRFLQNIVNNSYNPFTIISKKRVTLSVCHSYKKEKPAGFSFCNVWILSLRSRMTVCLGIRMTERHVPR